MNRVPLSITAHFVALCLTAAIADAQTNGRCHDVITSRQLAAKRWRQQLSLQSAGHLATIVQVLRSASADSLAALPDSDYAEYFRRDLSQRTTISLDDASQSSGLHAATAALVVRSPDVFSDDLSWRAARLYRALRMPESVIAAALSDIAASWRTRLLVLVAVDGSSRRDILLPDLEAVICLIAARALAMQSIFSSDSTAEQLLTEDEFQVLSESAIALVGHDCGQQRVERVSGLLEPNTPVRRFIWSMFSTMCG